MFYSGILCQLIAYIHSVAFQPIFLCCCWTCYCENYFDYKQQIIHVQCSSLVMEKRSSLCGEFNFHHFYWYDHCILQYSLTNCTREILVWKELLFERLSWQLGYNFHDIPICKFQLTTHFKQIFQAWNKWMKAWSASLDKRFSVYDILWGRCSDKVRSFTVLKLCLENE